ncbi:MAG: CapA family protein [Candidatus Pristimantibacillus sp.]
MTEIQIAAVGDIMTKASLIRNAQCADGSYSFENLFAHVTPYLEKADLTIGNLETNFANRGRNYNRRNSRGPMFTCPDELAPALKKAGFDVVVTANNHCMDYGTRGLLRTLQVLDSHQIAHTGTYSSFKQSREFLIQEVKGIRIGILSYTIGTNSNPIPANKQWLVNRMKRSKIIRDLKAIRKKVDLVIVYAHFGSEYHYSPNTRQRKLVNLFFKYGANIVLGSHPHVLQPVNIRNKKQFVIYSLGNFVCSKLKNNPYTQSSVILNMTINKDDKGNTTIEDINYISTSVNRSETSGNTEVVPIQDALNGSIPDLTAKQRARMIKLMQHTESILKRIVK